MFQFHLELRCSYHFFLLCFVTPATLYPCRLLYASIRIVPFLTDFGVPYHTLPFTCWFPALPFTCWLYTQGDQFHCTGVFPPTSPLTVQMLSVACPLGSVAPTAFGPLLETMPSLICYLALSAVATFSAVCREVFTTVKEDFVSQMALLIVDWPQRP